MKILKFIPIAALALLASCASQRQATKDSPSTTTTATRTDASARSFINRVHDNRVLAENIVSSMSFRLQTGEKNISVSGKLSMRHNQIVRLQLSLPIIGTEVGRIDFTPDHVLLVDRLHKEYVEAAYSDVSFLRDNGIDFYMLQALFWNQLFLPGRQTLGDAQLKSFAADLTAGTTNVPVSYTQGQLSYQWEAARQTAQLLSALITYQSTQHGKSTLAWTYGDFRSMGQKQFPGQQSFTFTTNATRNRQSATVTLSLDNLKTTSDWDTTTRLSAKYKKVEVDEILKKLTNL